MRKSDPDLAPLPKWRQRRARLAAWWHGTHDRRVKAAKSLGKAGRKGLTLAISVLGATLISYGVHSVYPAAGFVTAGLLLWAVQWNYGEERGNG